MLRNVKNYFSKIKNRLSSIHGIEKIRLITANTTLFIQDI